MSPKGCLPLCRLLRHFPVLAESVCRSLARSHPNFIILERQEVFGSADDLQSIEPCTALDITEWELLHGAIRLHRYPQITIFKDLYSHACICPPVCLSVCLPACLPIYFEAILLCIPEWPGTCNVFQVGLKVTEVHLPLPCWV